MKQPKQIEPNTAQRCWVQIDLAAIEHNYRAIRESYKPMCVYWLLLRLRLMGMGPSQ